MKAIVASDTGNHTTKMIMNGVFFKQPTVTHRLYSSPNIMKNEDEKIHALMNHLLLDISSQAIKRNGLYMVGQRAKAASSYADTMNIHVGRKTDSDLPPIMTLSMIAGKAVQDTFNQKNKLPETISIESFLTGAIPASEYSHDRAEKLETKYTKQPHLVTVHVDDRIVGVTISFNEAKITQEGIPALYALLQADEDILAGYDGPEKSPIDFRDKRALHVDIGDGTSEYIYTEGVNPVPDKCSGARRGVGHATEQAIKMLTEHTGGYVTLTRQQYSDILADQENNYHDNAKRFIDETMLEQSDKILQDVEEKYTELGASVDYIMVYGGGSIAFKESLQPELKAFTDQVGTHLLWIPKQYAIDMNATGMDILNRQLFYKDVITV